MANSGLKGPYVLTEQGINTAVSIISPGAYALGASRDNTFYVGYVGRSDSDVRGRLRDHVDAYAQFKYEYYASPKAAFEKECHLYHDFTPAANDVHPARPSGSGWKCPRCKAFG